MFFNSYTILQPNNIDYIIEKITNTKTAYLREGLAMRDIMNLYPHKSVAIAEEKPFPVLIGHSINKRLNANRIKIYKM